MVDLNKLSPEALKAAMKGGTNSWGQWGSAEHHHMYVEELAKSNRRMRIRKCYCGCGKRQTHGAFTNGVILMGGCELSCHRHAKEVNAAHSR